MVSLSTGPARAVLSADAIQKQSALIQRIAAQQLRGCTLLPGNVVKIPVMGAHAIAVVAYTGLGVSSNTAAGSAAAENSALPASVTSTTQVNLSLGSETGDEQDSASQAARTASEADGLLQKAREAAAGSVAASARDVAAAAAERALRSGARYGVIVTPCKTFAAVA